MMRKVSAKTKAKKPLKPKSPRTRKVGKAIYDIRLKNAAKKERSRLLKLLKQHQKGLKTLDEIIQPTIKKGGK